MRKLTDHIVSGDQSVQLEIEVMDEPGAGGANHHYKITGFNTKGNPFLRENNVKVKFGLRAQGHLPTVNFMLATGATWDEIGGAIGWHGPAVERFWMKPELKLPE